MRLAVALLLSALTATCLAAQGVTSAAVRGTVTRDDGTPVAGAIVRVTNDADGQRWQVFTGAKGTYNLEAVTVGGPYRIEVRALGLSPGARDSLILALGQRLDVDFTLTASAVELAGIDVTAARQRGRDRTGPGQIISRERIAKVPNQNRDFLSLLALSPLVAISPSAIQAPTGGITIAGQNRLLNAFQIDGGVNHDLYTGRLPGRETLQRPIGLDALEEIQVLVAPFDVRHGGFAGGLANAVTRSGTNMLRGSVFAFRSDGTLLGDNVSGAPAEGFAMWQYGASAGGPLIRDRAHFFVSAELQRRNVPDPGPLISDTSGGGDTLNIGSRYSSAVRFQDLLRGFGMEPGTLGPVDRRVPATDLFGKLSLQLGTNNRVEISHHFTQGNREGFIARQFGRYFLSSVASEQPAAVNTSRLILTSVLRDRWVNELIAGGVFSRDECQSFNGRPLVQARSEKALLVAGTAQTCPLVIRQRALELTDNLTTQLATHSVTLGTHVEFLRFADTQLQTSAGLWRFANLNALQLGTSTHYERSLWGATSASEISVRAANLSGYAQDAWELNRHFTLTVGLRADVAMYTDDPAMNGAAESTFGIQTGRLPRTTLWSPRVAMRYVAGMDDRTVMRGGVGLFTGRPPYAWIASAFRGDGTRELFLSCDPPDVPAFDPVDQPTTCSNGATPKPRLAFFDRTVRNPQNLKVAAGVDHLLPRGVLVSIDVIHTRARHQLYFSDVNLLRPATSSTGEWNRPLYGTVSAAGVLRAARQDTAFGQVVHMTDRKGDRSTSASIQLRRAFGARGEASVFYSRTEARDRMSVVNFQSRPNFENTPLDGTIADRRLASSYFEVPHRVNMSAMARWSRRGSATLMYVGASGSPYTWTINGDANGDGVGAGGMTNDAVYVPRDSMDITLVTPSQWALLDSIVRAEPCLARQRGRLLARNSCRNPWFGTINLRATQNVLSVERHSVEIVADVYNLPNMLRRSWGQARVTTHNPGEPLLQLGGYDAIASRGRYQVLASMASLRQLQDLASRWQLQLGMRYGF